MPHLDRNGRPLAIGDEVQILALPDGMSVGLPAKEAAFIDGSPGKLAVIEGLVGSSDVEIRIGDPAEGTIHFILLPSGDLDRVA
jgi:hypothetical protein